jgi:hypothetical protein
LNRSVAQRTISKQEAMCELGKLPMVICSETIETVSLSGASRLQLEPNIYNNTFFAKYKNRVGNENLSLHQYFHYIKNDIQRSSSQKEIVPHYVGGSAIPKYPITQSYATIELLKHKPWNISNQPSNSENVIEEFEFFLKSEQCPLSVKLNYERAKVTSDLLKRGIAETIAEEVESSAPYDGINDPDTIDILNTTENMAETTNTLENLENSGLNIGRNYDWGKRFFQVRKIKWR